MTEAEAKDFVVEVAYVAFPAARKFVLLNSSDPVATVAAQSRALIGIERKSAQAVIDRWLMGLGQAPDQSDFENLPLAIKRAVARSMPAKASGCDGDDRKHASATPRPKIDSYRYLSDLKRCSESLKNGELSNEEVDRMRREVMAALDLEWSK